MLHHFSMNKNKNMRITGIGRLPVLLAFLVFAGVSVPLSAQSVWSGNASVDSAEFVNFLEDFPLAGASSSFTRNTKIQVTNPQNNKTVEVTIVKRAPKPGVFLVLSEAAGNALSIPSGQVIPVQVQVISTAATSSYDEFRSSDPDINPAVSVPADEEAVPAEGTEEPVSTDIMDSEILPSPADEGFTAIPLSGEDTVPVPVPGDSLRVEREEPEVAEAVSSDAEIYEDETVESAPAVIAEGTLPEDMSAAPEAVSSADTEVITDADEISESILPTGDNVIYFLTPSDFRPPTGPVTVKENAEEIVPVLVERSSLEKFIVNQLKNGSSYIQLGAYTSPESIYEEILSIEDRYPMVVWTENGRNGTLYKLLVGPLTRDETGVLTYRFRSTGYSDLFLFKP